ncbi:MAG: rhomboid family intramembrane serine protease [Bacteroidetes bacterium]|nr:rhomboid family intramembrane serine protease [Bacteroidota bacterium]
MESSTEKHRVRTSLFVPALFVLLMWLVKISEFVFDIRLSFLGIEPLTAKGLAGIVLSPFLHGDWNHLMANTVPVFVLIAGLYYFYRTLATEVLTLSVILSGLWVWLGARHGVHIGASGVIYALAAFLMLSGFLRRDNRLMALSFAVVFLYGSLIWGIFPELFPEKNISWEGHLSGLLAGVILALFFRNKGPQKRQYSWEIEEEEELEEKQAEAEAETGQMGDKQERPYWDIPQPDKNDLTVEYHFRKKKH